MGYPVVDFHCDVLMKLLLNPKLAFRNDPTGELDVTFERLRKGGSVLQTFAVFIPEDRMGRLEPILESIDLLEQKVLAIPEMAFIRTQGDLRRCMAEGKIGALLSLEGLEGLQGKLSLLRIMHRLGVRAAGFTWNFANWAADGAMEERGGGLTTKGKEFVRACDELGILLDVSHLSEKAFWDMADTASRTILASHSNARSILDHPRNLTDNQIRAIIALQGLVGVTFVPYFVSKNKTVTIDDLLKHIERICEQGGDRHLMLGSDFDGIELYVERLANPADMEHLQEALLKRYSEEQTKRFMSGNAIEFLLRHLPADR